MGVAWPRALLLLLAAVFLIEIFVILPSPSAIALIAASAWLALPGVWLVRAVMGASKSDVASWLLGPAIGLGFSVFGMLLLWAAGLQNWATVVLGPAFTWIVALLVRRVGGWRIRVPAFDRRDVMAVVIALAVVPAITWAPYDHVREPFPEGDAYRAYFTADFVWAMTVTAELAKGHLPPINPFLPHGEALHYYWMAHFLSGVLYHNVASWHVLVEQVVLLDGLVFGCAFVAFMYALARIAGASPAFAALAVIVGFVANSYEAMNRIWILSQGGGSLATLKEYNIDAVTRWFYDGMPVDGLQRLLLYQPHHLTGYAMGLAALWIVGFAEDVSEVGIALTAGVLLGFEFIFSTFTAIIVGCALGLLYAYRLIEQRAWKSVLPCAILGVGPAAVGALLTRVFGYTSPETGSLMLIGLNPVATRRWPLMLFLSFGPLLLAGLIGLGRVRWVRQQGTAAAALVVAAFAFYFLVDVRDMDGVWVGWRSGHQLLIAFSMIGAAALTSAWQRHRLRVGLVAAILLACIPAVPTVAVDVYNAQDVWNRTPGPSFPWTLIISPLEREALEWVKRATPPDAVVQPEMVARRHTHWAYLPAFGERRMAAGPGMAMIPARMYEHASEVVRSGIFDATSARDAHFMAKGLGVDYLWIGAVERRWYRIPLEGIAAHPEFFRKVFKNDEVTIYEVAP